MRVKLTKSAPPRGLSAGFVAQPQADSQGERPFQHARSHGLTGSGAMLTAELGSMPDAELHRPRSLSAYDVSPAWVLHHLLQHEAEHRAHVALVRDLYLSERDEA